MKRLTLKGLFGAGLFWAGFAYPLTGALAQPNEAPETRENAPQSAIEQRSEQVVQFINQDIDAETVFSDRFLKALPVEQLNGFTQSLIAQFGKAVSVTHLDPNSGNRSSLHVAFERGIAKGAIAIDPGDDNKVSELVFRSVDPVSAEGDSLETIAAELSALPGDVGAYFGPLDGTEPALSLQSGKQFALGSTFKLYVLAALAREIAEGRRNWSDVVTLDTRSFPSGMMQDWPRGAPVTLHSLASLMISISDNTATDQLIKELGRDTVFQMMVDTGHSSPQLNNPFITTRELFELKGGPAQRLQAYRAAAGDAKARLAILGGIPANPVSSDDVEAAFGGDPIALDIEWFASADDLAKLLRSMNDTGLKDAFGIMAINKGLPSSTFANWSYAGYKGGSEPGVLQVTWLLTDNAGIDHVLTLSWSDPNAPVELATLLGFAQRLLVLPR